MNLNDASKFCYRLGTGLKAGADIVRLLESESSVGPSNQRHAMRLLVEGAKAGEELSSVMETNRAYFPPLMTAMTRVGEEAGRLERTLLMLSKHFEQKLATRRMFIGSITWPVMQMVAGILVISLLIYLMGILTPAGGGEMADILGFGLSGPEGVMKFWGYLTIFFGSIAAFVWAFTRNIAGVQNLAPILYMVPKFGTAIQTITISRFCWTMALALDAGLDPIRSIRLSLESTDSDYYRHAADASEDSIRDGSTLADAIDATGCFPRDFIARVEIAEHSGTDAEAMDHLAQEYDERAKSAVKMLALIATIIVRVTVVLVLIFMIFRIAGTYLSALNGAMDPINSRGN